MSIHLRVARSLIGLVGLIVLTNACGESSSDSASKGSGGVGGSGGTGATGGSGGSGGEKGQWVWQSQISSPTELNAVWVSAPDDVWAVGDGGTVVHWDGSKWSTEVSGTTNHLHAIWGSSATDLWAVAGGLGGPNTANLIHFDGGNWSPAESGTPDNLNGIWGSGPKDIWAVGASGVEGVIVHFDGSNWTQSLTSDKNSLRSIWGSSADDIWTVGSIFYPGNTGEESILHRTSAATWTPVSSDAPGIELTGVWSGATGDAWAVGANTMVHWNGTDWSKVSDPVVTNMAGVWGADPKHVTAVGSNAAIVEWDGSKWSSRVSGGAGLNAVGGTDSNNRWAVGENGTIFQYQPDSTGELTCTSVGGECTAVSECATGLGHISDYACGGGASTLCCVSQTACGGGEIECCADNGARSRPMCHNGAFECLGGTSPCPLPP